MALDPTAYSATLQPLRYSAPGDIVIKRRLPALDVFEEVVLTPINGGFIAFDAISGQPATFTAEEMRTALNIAGTSVVALTALTGGTANALDSLVTAGGVTATNSIRECITGSAGGGDLAITRWVLVAGTNAEDGVSYVRPDDYNASTNTKVWVRIG